MDKMEQGLIGGMVMAALIGFGRLLDSDEKITLKKAVGRGLMCTGLGACGGLVLIIAPGIHPIAVTALSAAFASLGTSALEKWLTKRSGGG